MGGAILWGQYRIFGPILHSIIHPLETYFIQLFSAEVLFTTVDWLLISHFKFTVHRYPLYVEAGPSSRVGKRRFFGFCRTRFFLILRQICPVFRQSFIKFTKIYQSLPILPKFTKFLPIVPKFTKCVIYTVLSWFWIVVIYWLFPPNLDPQKASIEKNTLSNSAFK